MAAYAWRVRVGRGGRGLLHGLQGLPMHSLCVPLSRVVYAVAPTLLVVYALLPFCLVPFHPAFISFPGD